MIKPRRTPGPDWPEYFVSLALNFRQSVLRHRNAATVLIEHLPRETLVGSFEDAARFLRDSGVPTHLHVQILDGMETLCIGAVLAEAARRPRGRYALFPPVDADQYPYLTEALEQNEFSVKELFAARIRNFLYGVILSDGGMPAIETSSA